MSGSNGFGLASGLARLPSCIVCLPAFFQRALPSLHYHGSIQANMSSGHWLCRGSSTVVAGRTSFASAPMTPFATSFGRIRSPSAIKQIPRVGLTLRWTTVETAALTLVTPLPATLAVSKDTCVPVKPSLNESRSTEVLAIQATLSALAAIAIILRFAAKRFSSAKIWWDDILILPALAFALAVFIDSTIAVSNGFGRHTTTLDLYQLAVFGRTYFAFILLASTSVTFTKLSILCFYLRILPSRRFRIACFVTAALTVIWLIVIVFATTFACRPVHYFWDKSVPGGRCLDIMTILVGLSGANGLGDLMALLIPIPWLWNLQLPLGQRINVIAIFLVGGLVCVFSFVRIPFFLIDQSDITWTCVNACIFITVGLDFAIICASLPTLRPLYIRVAPVIRRWPAKLPFNRRRDSDYVPPFDPKSISSTCPTIPEKAGFFHRDRRTPRLPTQKVATQKGFYTNVMASLARVEDRGDLDKPLPSVPPLPCNDSKEHEDSIV